MVELKHINTTVTYSGSYKSNKETDIEDAVKKKLNVGGKLYKHRLSYKTVWDENEQVLTFIMFNPSTANQYTTDPTINNCIKLAKKGVDDIKFGGIEIYNLITIRHPSVIETMKLYVKNAKKHTSVNPLWGENFDFQEKHICLAWGGKISKGKNDSINLPYTLSDFNNTKKELVANILEKLKGHKNLYIYGAKENLQNCTKPRHPSPNAFNTIKNPNLRKIKFEELDTAF